MSLNYIIPNIRKISAYVQTIYTRRFFPHVRPGNEAKNGHIEVVNRLLEHGVSVDLQDKVHIIQDHNF